MTERGVHWRKCGNETDLLPCRVITDTDFAPNKNRKPKTTNTRQQEQSKASSSRVNYNGESAAVESSDSGGRRGGMKMCIRACGTDACDPSNGADRLFVAASHQRNTLVTLLLEQFVLGIVLHTLLAQLTA